MHARQVARAQRRLTGRRGAARRAGAAEKPPEAPEWAVVVYRSGEGHWLAAYHPTQEEANERAQAATARELDCRRYGGEPGYAAAFAARVSGPAEGDWLALEGGPGAWRIASYATEAERAGATPPARHVSGPPGGAEAPPTPPGEARVPASPRCAARNRRQAPSSPSPKDSALSRNPEGQVFRQAAEPSVGPSGWMASGSAGAQTSPAPPISP